MPGKGRGMVGQTAVYLETRLLYAHQHISPVCPDYAEKLVSLIISKAIVRGKS